MGVRSIAAACVAISLGSAVSAAETTTYIDAAEGRLVRVVKNGLVNNGVITEYAHDKAANWVKVRVSGK